MKKIKIKRYYRVVCSGGGYLASDGYSKWNERFKLFHEGKLSWEEIYGYEQAQDHIKEYFNRESEYQKYNRAETLFIEYIEEKSKILDSFIFKNDCIENVNN